MSDRKSRGFGKLLSRFPIPSVHVSIAGCYAIAASAPPGGRGNRVRPCRTSSMSQSISSRKSSKLPHHVDCRSDWWSTPYIIIIHTYLVHSDSSNTNPKLVGTKVSSFTEVFLFFHLFWTVIDIIITIIRMINNMVITSIVASRPPGGWANRVRAAQSRGAIWPKLNTLHYKGALYIYIMASCVQFIMTKALFHGKCNVTLFCRFKFS